MRRVRGGLLIAATVGLFLGLTGGCPTDGLNLGGNDGSGGTQSGKRGIELQSTLTYVKTDVLVRYDASLEVGDNLIVFGTGALTGVAYVVPAQQPPTAKPIAGDFQSNGFAIAGQKILLLTPSSELAVFDTATETATTISAKEITVDSLPGNDNQSAIGPLMADGQLAITLNRRDSVDDGISLKVVDVSGAEPVITALPNFAANPAQVAIDASAQIVVTYGEDSFYVYDLTQPTTEPRRINLSGEGGISGPFAYSEGHILYVARDSLQNIRLLSLETGTAEALSKNPGNRDQPLTVAGTRFGYFLRRGTDNIADVYRSAIGVAGLDPTEGGVAGEDPALNNPTWAGFGLDMAMTPAGDWIFISGDQSINVTCEFLQVSNGSEFKAFSDVSGGYLNATDVDASEKLVAFKVGADQDTKLAYIVLP